MQGYKAYSQPADTLKLDSPLSTPKRQGSGGDNRFRSHSLTEGGNKTEAALRAQLIELRRELSSSQQQVEQTRQDLQQRQELLRFAAGEARHEVLALRKHKEESEKNLTDANLKVAALEEEIRDLRSSSLDKAFESVEPNGKSEYAAKLQHDLELKEEELQRLRANERVSNASKEALTAQLGELVEKLAELEAELAESKKARSALQQKAEQLEHSQQTLAQTSSKMQQQIDLLKREKEQLESKAELLQNELEVAGAEGTEDRLAGVARLLELSQECQDLKARLEATQQAELPARTDESTISSAEERSNEDEAYQDLSNPSRNPLANRRPEALELPSPTADERRVVRSPGSSLPTPQKQLLTELVEASQYLQGLNARLDVNQSPDIDGHALEEDAESGQSAKDAIASFTTALKALQGSLGQQKLQALLGSPSLVQIHADSSQAQGSPVSKTTSRRLAQGLLGGLIVLPAIAAVVAFLPKRH